MQIFGGIFRHVECFGTWPTQHNNSDSPSTKWNRRSVLVTCAAILITGFQNKFFQMWCSGPLAPCVMKRPSIYKKFSGICHDIDKFWHPNSSFSHKFSLCYCVHDNDQFLCYQICDLWLPNNLNTYIWVSCDLLSQPYYNLYVLSYF